MRGSWRRRHSKGCRRHEQTMEKEDSSASSNVTSVTGQRRRSHRSSVPLCEVLGVHKKKDNSVSSNKQRMLDYRKRIKENPDMYKTYLEYNRERNRSYRANLSNEQRDKQRKTTRERVANWRKKRQKELEEGQHQSDVSGKKTIPKTRHKVKTTREKWKTCKQKQRESMTPQRKRRINERRRQLYALKKEANALQKKANGTKSTEVNSEKNVGYSKDAERKAVYRARKSIPSSPHKYARVVGKLATKTTPRKRKALEDEGILPLSKKFKTFEENMGKLSCELKTNRRKRDRHNLQRRRLLVGMMPWSKKGKGSRMERKESGVSWRFLSKASKVSGVWDNKPRVGLDDETVEKVIEFFKSPGTSTCLPEKKAVQCKTLEPRHVLEKSLQKTYNQFRKENPSCVLGFSKFAELRPKSVKTMKSNCLQNCLCEYCTNIELKVKAVKTATAGRKEDFGFKDKYDINEHSLCCKEADNLFYSKQCINRVCEKCGVKQVEKITKKALANNRTMTWNRWESQTYNDVKTGKRKTRKMLRLKNDSVAVFLKELSEEMETFSLHLHNAMWQHHQFKGLVKNVPENWVIFCMDYAENYTCIYQDEAQSAHWSHDQATLFSIVAYFKCTVCGQNSHDSILFISDDKCHDSHAAQHFVTIANYHLAHAHGLKIEREIHFSDGAASQFKSKTPFADVANSTNDFGFPIEKHFFGSRHGKGPCDGEFGVVKRVVSQAVAARRARVSSALEFFEFAEAELTKKDVNCTTHKNRTFFFVKANEINRTRPDRTNIKSIPGTRKLHSIKPCRSSTSGIATRKLSCFCTSCIHETDDSPCKAIDHVDEWEAKLVGKVQKKPKVKAKKGKKPKQVRKSRKSKLPSEVTLSLTDNTREEYFFNVLSRLQRCSSFDDLQAVCLQLKDDSEYKGLHLNVDEHVNMVDNHLVADKLALRLLDKESLPLGSKTDLPIIVTGDGNCLPRAISVACFGHENAHVEIRVRIVVELATNTNYTDNTYLNRGISLPDEEASNLSKTYTMFSDHYTAGDKITQIMTERIYNAEVLSIVKNGSYMGIWQLFSAASVVGTKILSVYPKHGDKVPHMVLNRPILPQAQQNIGKPIIIMWTSTRQDLSSLNWTPNHFVLVIAQHKEETGMNLIDDVCAMFSPNIDDESAMFSPNIERICRYGTIRYIRTPCNKRFMVS